MMVTCANAQDFDNTYYAFGGGGATISTFRDASSLFHIGGGGEFVAANRLGAGAELGYLGPWSNGSNGIGVLSVNGLYRFPGTSSQFFVTGGYSLGFRSRAASFGNVGVGINIWSSSNLGLRLELRDHIRDGSTQWLIARVGIAFR